MPQKKNQKKLSRRELIKQRTQIVRESTKTYARKIKSDTKKAISTALIAAFGFVIALAWKDVIIEYVDTLTASSFWKVVYEINSCWACCGAYSFINMGFKFFF